MRKLFIPVVLSFVCVLGTAAQEKFLDKLVKPVNGQGTVRVIQDAEIARMVNGGQDNVTAKRTETASAKTTDGAGTTASSAGQATSHGEDENGASTTVKSTRKMKANGYRIQVYAGGNSRDSRLEAQRMANKVKTYFGDMPTYTHFQSPRWICRVGDFRTYEEASQALHEMRETKQFDEALIVKSVIQIPY